jgi:hypothetical protein
MSPLSPIVSEFASTEETEDHDRWFRAKVEKATANTGPKIPHDQVMAEMRTLTDLPS